MFFRFRPFQWTLLLVPMLVGSPATAQAAGSCKGDRKVDVPIQFGVTFESAGRVHLSAFGGSDKSGWIVPVGYGAWHLYDSSGKQLDFFTRSDLGYASKDMLKEANLEGLVPGESYTVELISQDYCNNKGSFREVVTMPAAAPESNGPTVSAPTTVQVGFMSYYKQLQFSATDDTGLKRVAVYINGDLVTDNKYFDGLRFRWWVDPYTLDSVQSTLEGPNFYVAYPDGYKGVYALVEIVVEDIFGNQTRTSAQLSL
jgi:hypothetical protein